MSGRGYRGGGNYPGARPKTQRGRSPSNPRFNSPYFGPGSNHNNNDDGNITISLTREQFEQLNLGKKNPAITSSDVNGDVEIPEICVFSISNTCKFKDNKCHRLHAKCPQQWQFCIGQIWYNFPEFHSKELEESFQVPANSSTGLSAIRPERLRKSHKQYVDLLGKDILTADFSEMKVMNSSKTFLYDIRRLSTHSSATTKNKMATVYEWYFRDEHKNWIKYGQPNTDNKADCVPNISSYDIEMKFEVDKVQTFEFESPRHKYVVDFTKMRQKNLKTQVSRSIRRRPSFKPIKGGRISEMAGNFSLPSYWAPMGDAIVEKFVLSRTDSEFCTIDSLMKQTLGVYSIVKIERNQNPHLWMSYSIRKDYILKKNKTTDVNEKLLFHGTHPSNIQKIIEENLDWRLHGSSSNRHMYGRGAYFSSSAKYSKDYCVPLPGSQRVMFVVRVMVGTYDRGSSIMVRPPINSATGSLHDTTVNDVTHPSIFVKYESQEYYPEYTVYFNA